ncbi:2-oxoglutarate (2OG) and Fe(II)-dependent oxygenase superfamily protein [Rhynchospora pubera]|uniref:2-oxoglutarate (2OG) and Fe(II)-dependent oxygenase superfamily protein n=1 Tax=Rhynchospora pubera TaxID=906938 RepID=A0AAV8BPP6_9POAL|nr:2-oxoglutarate (2OG) and Fe(II)-dependent oxygenase superfamily protein [Rhynchospora pubera]KAJ4746208.1 2-oxoglutarate (2OG) and Fe(II)-dependent oxygenase superfamily protein [Rhynchospora pubera]
MAKGEVHSQCAGYTLSVPNVQSLATSLDKSAQIPERYVRPEAQADPIARNNEIELPVIDLAKLIDPEFSEEEAAKLHFTCQEWGFFQLVNHGVPEELIEGLKANTLEFFNKPLEEKMVYKQDNDGTLQGYGQAFVMSEKQKLDWSDLFYVMTRPITLRNMKFWPTSPSTFRDNIDRYSLELTKLASCLWQYIAKNLGVATEVFAQLFKDHPQGMRFNYPPCPEADKVIGVSPHSDATGFSILLQINDVQGLQIRKDGEWIAVSALPNAFIVNLGDITEVLSNGLYKSIEHRAMINTENPRISLVAFHGPDNSIMLQPLPEVVTTRISFIYVGPPIYSSR